MTEVVYKLSLFSEGNTSVRLEYYASYLVADNIGRIFVEKDSSRSYTVSRMEVIETT